jgi:polysaccharide deacetylase family protein (PEP-CTERM system associated)
MNNIITIDLEDWHALSYRRLTGIMPISSKNVFRQVARLLNILEQYQTKATFFVLGSLAESHPDLVKLIAACGHEIASHGYSHQPIYKLSRKEFKAETERSKILLENITGSLVTGYRAAEFSIIRQSLWALEILAELGFTYDSSIFPMYHRRYGIYSFSEEIKQYNLSNNLQIIEIPLSIISLGKLKWSFAGGGYFRLTPLGLISKIITKKNIKKNPVVLYFHPYEFDSDYLNTFDVFQPSSLKEGVRCLRCNFHQNLGRKSVFNKLSALLKNYRFLPCREYLSQNIIN